ncbi:MAG: hypothetical protein VKP70_11180 [Cyanobacteriota bacterium]|nr:hypothetical protein [Cyanobacteriota bacterium]
MSRSLPQPPAPDWSTLLLDALQRRDAARAVVLAQRCVHRQGMATLDALLERADGSAGQEGEARAWLSLLLKEGSPSSQGSPSSKGSPRVESPGTLDSPVSVGAAPAYAPPQAPPHSPEAPPHPPEGPPPLESLPSQAKTPPAGPPPPTQALDQAFAPLEIAFPPLPNLDAPSERERGQDELATPDSFPDHASRLPAGDSAEPAAGQGWQVHRERAENDDRMAPDRNDSVVDTVAFDDGPVDDRGLEDDGLDVEPPALARDGDLAPAAAPVPTFDVAPVAKPPRFTSSRVETPAERPQEADAPPASKSLESWRAWLPGAFRPRRRP